MNRIGKPTGDTNCFGRGIIGGKGVIFDASEIIEDDFIHLEKHEKGEQLVGIDPKTGELKHMALVLNLDAAGQPNKVASEAGIGGALYISDCNEMKAGFGGLRWEPYRIKPEVEAKLRFEQHLDQCLQSLREKEAEIKKLTDTIDEVFLYGPGKNDRVKQDRWKSLK